MDIAEELKQGTETKPENTSPESHPLEENTQEDAPYWQLYSRDAEQSLRDDIETKRRKEELQAKAPEWHPEEREFTPSGVPIAGEYVRDADGTVTKKLYPGTGDAVAEASWPLNANAVANMFAEETPDPLAFCGDDKWARSDWEGWTKERAQIDGVSEDEVRQRLALSAYIASVGYMRGVSMGTAYDLAPIAARKLGLTKKKDDMDAVRDACRALSEIHGRKRETPTVGGRLRNALVAATDRAAMEAFSETAGIMHAGMWVLSKMQHPDGTSYYTQRELDRFLEDFRREYMELQRDFSEHAEKAIKDPDYYKHPYKPSAFYDIGLKLLMEAPAQVIQLAPALAGAPGAGAALTGMASGYGKSAELATEHTELTDGQKNANAWATGFINAGGAWISGSFLTGALGKAFPKMAKIPYVGGLFRDTSAKAGRTTAKAVGTYLAKSYGVEFSQEGAEQLGENYVDLMTGVYGDPRMLSPEEATRILTSGVAESAFLGGLMGLTMEGAIGARSIANRQRLINELSADARRTVAQLSQNAVLTEAQAQALSSARKILDGIPDARLGDELGRYMNSKEIVAMQFANRVSEIQESAIDKQTWLDPDSETADAGEQIRTDARTKAETQTFEEQFSRLTATEKADLTDEGVRARRDADALNALNSYLTEIRHDPQETVREVLKQQKTLLEDTKVTVSTDVTWENMPADARTWARNNGYSGDAIPRVARLSDGGLWINADRVAPSEARETLLRGLSIEKGLRSVLGAENFDGAMKQVYAYAKGTDAMNAIEARHAPTAEESESVDESGRISVAPTLDDETKVLCAQEYLAQVAETAMEAGKLPGAIRRATQALRQALKKTPFANGALSDRDLLTLVSRSLETLKGGKGTIRETDAGHYRDTMQVIGRLADELGVKWHASDEGEYEARLDERAKAKGLTREKFLDRYSVNGWYLDADGAIVVAPGERAMRAFCHEAMHWVEKNNPELYGQLERAIEEDLAPEAQEEMKRLSGLYADVPGADPRKEFLADRLGQLMESRDGLRAFTETLERRQAGLGRRILIALRDFLRHLAELFQKSGNPKNINGTFVKDFNALADRVGKLLAEGTAATAQTGSIGDVAKYSMSQIDGFGEIPFVTAEEFIPKGVATNAKSLERWIRENLAGEYATRDGKTVRADATHLARSEYAQSIGRKQGNKAQLARARAVGILPDFLSVARICKDTEAENKHGAQNKIWQNRIQFAIPTMEQGRVRDIQGYDVTLTIRKKGENLYAYDFTNLTENSKLSAACSRSLVIPEGNHRTKGSAGPATRTGLQTGPSGELAQNVARETEIPNGTDGIDRLSLSEITRRFDEELERQQENALEKGHVYQLGTPGAILRGAGLPDLPIELTASRLSEKAANQRHPFEIADIAGLPEALNNPIAIFRYGDPNKLNIITELSRNGKNFLVGIQMNSNWRGVQVNDIRGLFPKDTHEWLNWIQEGKAIYLNKQKTQEVVAQQRINLAEVGYLHLDDVLKIVWDFKNANETASAPDDIHGIRVAESPEDIGDGNIEYSLRESDPPKKTGIGYKVFVLRDGKLYPPMVANPGGEATPVGVWLDADAAPVAGTSKTGRPQVRQGGKGTQGGSGFLAYRPGWHLGEIPYATQFNRRDANGNRTLFPGNFVWAEVEYAKDRNYQTEAEAEGLTDGGKFRHSYAGLKRVPTDGYYMYRTNPDPNTDPWIITGAMKVNRILSDAEVDAIVEKAGRTPQRREGGQYSLSARDESLKEIDEARISQAIDAELKTAEERGVYRFGSDDDRARLKNAAERFFREFARREIILSEGRKVYFMPDPRAISRAARPAAAWAQYAIHAVTSQQGKVEGKEYFRRKYNQAKVEAFGDIVRVISEENTFIRQTGEQDTDVIGFIGRTDDGHTIQIITRLDQNGNICADLREVTTVIKSGKRKNPPLMPLAEAVSKVESLRAAGYLPETAQNVTPENGIASGYQDPAEYSMTDLRPDGTRKDLIAVRVTDLKEIAGADRINGFVYPSIAITKDSIHHLMGGDVSILFDKREIDPRRSGRKVFSGDAWTPTFPDSTSFVRDPKSVSKIVDKFRDTFSKSGLYDQYGDKIEEFLSELGTIISKEELRWDFFAKCEYLLENGHDLGAYLKENLWGEKGLASYVQDYINSNFNGFLEWCKEKYDDYGIDEKLIRVGRRFLPATGWNIIKAMDREHRKLNEYDIDELHRIQTKYNSFDKIIADEGRLRNMDRYERQGLSSGLVDKFRDLVSDYLGECPVYKDWDSWNYKTQTDIIRFWSKANGDKGRFMRLLSEYQKKPSAEVAEKIYDCILEIRNLDTPYFEAKPRDVIPFEGVLAVVIPSDTGSETRAILKRRGVRVYEYTRGDSQSRLDAINRAADATKARFSLSENSADQSGAGDPETAPARLSELSQAEDPQVRAMAAANPSTPSEALQALLSDSDAEIRKTASSELTRRGEAAAIDALSEIADGKEYGTLKGGPNGEIRYPLGKSGKGGMGFLHIVEQRMAKDGATLEEAIQIAKSVGAAAEYGQETNVRLNTHHFDLDGARAIVAMDENGNRIITGYEINGADGSSGAVRRSENLQPRPHVGSEEAVAALGDTIAREKAALQRDREIREEAAARGREIRERLSLEKAQSAADPVAERGETTADREAFDAFYTDEQARQIASMAAAILSEDPNITAKELRSSLEEKRVRIARDIDAERFLRMGREALEKDAARVAETRMKAVAPGTPVTNEQLIGLIDIVRPWIRKGITPKEVVRKLSEKGATITEKGAEKLIGLCRDEISRRERSALSKRRDKYLYEMDPFFQVLDAFGNTNTCKIIPAQRFWGQDFSGSFIHPDFVRYSGKTPTEKCPKDKIDAKLRAASQQPGMAHSDDLAAMYVRRFGGDELDVEIMLIDHFNGLTWGKIDEEMREYENADKKEAEAMEANFLDENAARADQLLDEKEGRPITMNEIEEDEERAYLLWQMLTRDPKDFDTSSAMPEFTPALLAGLNAAIIKESSGTLKPADGEWFIREYANAWERARQLGQDTEDIEAIEIDSANMLFDQARDESSPAATFYAKKLDSEREKNDRLRNQLDETVREWKKRLEERRLQFMTEESHLRHELGKLQNAGYSDEQRRELARKAAPVLAGIPEDKAQVLLERILTMGRYGSEPSDGFPKGERAARIDELMNDIEKSREALKFDEARAKLKALAQRWSTRATRKGILTGRLEANTQRKMNRISEILGMGDAAARCALSACMEARQRLFEESGSESATVPYMGHNRDAFALAEEANLLETYGALDTAEKVDAAYKQLQELAKTGHDAFETAQAELAQMAERRAAAVKTSLNGTRDVSRVMGKTKDPSFIWRNEFIQKNFSHPLTIMYEMAGSDVVDFENSVAGEAWKAIERATYREKDRADAVRRNFDEAVGNAIGGDGIRAKGRFFKDAMTERNTGAFVTVYDAPRGIDGSGTEYVMTGRRATISKTIAIETARKLLTQYDLGGKDGSKSLDPINAEFVRRQIADHDARLETDMELSTDEAENARLNQEINDARKRGEIQLRLPHPKETSHREEIVCSKGQALQAILTWEQPDARAIMQWNGWTQETIDALRTFCGDEVLKLGEWMRQTLADGREELNAIVKKKYGAEMPEVENYFPTRYDRATRPGTRANIQAGQPRTMATGFLVQRRFHMSNLDMTQDAFKVFIGAMNDQAHFVEWAETIDGIKSVFLKSDVKDAIVNRYGKTVLNNFEDMVARLEGGGRKIETEGLIANAFRGFVPAALAFNISSALKQSLSASAYMNLVSVDEFLAAGRDIATYSPEFRKFLRVAGKSDYMKTRQGGGFTPDAWIMQAEAESTLPPDGSAFLRMINKAAFMPMTYGDTFSTLTGGYAAYRAALHEALRGGMTEEAAQESALLAWKSATDQTQQGSYQKDLNIYQTTALGRFGTMFLSNPIQVMNLEFRQFLRAMEEFRSGARGKAAVRIVRTAFINHIVIPTLMTFVSQMWRHGFRNWSKDDLPEFFWAWVFGPFDGLYLIGSALKDAAVWATGKAIGAKGSGNFHGGGGPLDLLDGFQGLGTLGDGEIDEKDFEATMEALMSAGALTSIVNPSVGGALLDFGAVGKSLPRQLRRTKKAFDPNQEEKPKRKK